MIPGGLAAIFAFVVIGLVAYAAFVAGTISTSEGIWKILILFIPYFGGLLLFSFGYELYDWPSAVRLTLISGFIGLAVILVVISIAYIWRILLAGGAGAGGAKSSSSGSSGDSGNSESSGDSGGAGESGGSGGWNSPGSSGDGGFGGGAGPESGESTYHSGGGHIYIGSNDRGKEPSECPACGALMPSGGGVPCPNCGVRVM